MFAFDVFSPDLTIWQQILALLIHLIPSFILIAILIVAWKWEKIGGIILTVTGVILFILVFNINYRQRNFSLTQSLINVSILCLPFIIAGVLFIVSYNRKHKKQAQN
jgi:prolipoprotein diacylglyceryltransferase